MTGTCTKCKREILWAVNPDTGAKVPLDPKALVFKVWTGENGESLCQPVSAGDFAVTHFSTCPDAAAFSGRNKSSEPKTAGVKGKPSYSDNDSFPFGKYKDKAFGEIPAHYLDWLRGQEWVKAEWPGVWTYISEENPSGRAVSQEMDEEPETQGDDENIPF